MGTNPSSSLDHDNEPEVAMNQTTWSAAALEGSLPAVQALHALGVDLNVVRNSDGRPLVCVAADAGDSAMLEALGEYGVDMNTQGLDGLAALHLAAGQGFDAVVESLLQFGAVTDIKAPDGRTPLIFAAQGGHDDVILNLLEPGAFDTSLDVDIVAADLRVKDDCKSGALEYAVRGDHADVVLTLLEHAADPNEAWPDGQTPLRHAAQAGLYDVAKHLLDRRADIRATDSQGLDALLLAVKSAEPLSSHTRVVRLLLERAANPNAEDPDQMTPLHWAVRRGLTDISKSLEAHGASLTARNSDGAIPKSHANFFHSDVERPTPSSSRQSLLQPRPTPRTPSPSDDHREMPRR